MAKQADAAGTAETPGLSNTVVTPAGAELTEGELGGISGGDKVVAPTGPKFKFTTTTKDKTETFLEY
jgi:hypothetical protein